MLTNEVKQRINTCRDILVGKLPDPKSQVIQITNALIYKFMDDQDRQSEKLGGKASFFTDSLKPYAWHKLFDSKLTNQERADLYVNGIEKLSDAQNLPELFREIFKEAYVPFKAAGTITLFIEEINKFSYHHSEELGNAYEYLLSIMGSQGDAGQFRTPRHIIEFMVDVIDPQKTEAVYDPACGTAGFLIAAYTHIAEANDKKLSASDKKKLAENISGIDISPDMAKMARVNLYLHGFTSPVINEGDTLSDEDLWGKKYDVILANPPFMSPTGGIIPHDKFGIKAKRAEVLFVDYIAEHLKLKGRAAIVVPEGVIFQSGVTYKALRKMLVEEGYLHTVISLPTGVFQPYSGVKTSILILDRERAKEANEVLFIKIENDGYSLSTQRTECDGEQLTEALSVVCAWQEKNKQEASFATWIDKNEIAKTGDYNLNTDLYRVFKPTSSNFDFIEVQEVIDAITPPGKLMQKDYGVSGLYPVIDQSIGRIAGYTNRTELLVNIEKPLVIFGDHTCVTKLIESPFVQGADGIKILKTKDSLDPSFLFYLLKYRPLKSDGYQRHFSKLKRYKIPLPPINFQREIVAELNRYQKIIDGARQVVENYQPSFKAMKEWDEVSIGDIAKVQGGFAFPSTQMKAKSGARVIKIANVKDRKFDPSSNPSFVESELLNKYANFKLEIGDVLISMTGTAGKRDYGNVCMVDIEGDFLLNQRVGRFIPNEKVLPDFLYFTLNQEAVKNNFFSNTTGGVRQGNISAKQIESIKMFLPPISEQKAIVKNLREEYDMINGNNILELIFTQKIKNKIVEVWGE